MRKTLFLLLLSVMCAGSVAAQSGVNYLNETEADYKNRMNWFSEAKFGMFIHFGLYSSLAGEYKGETVKEYAEWIQANADISSEEYAKLITNWNPKKFNANAIARLLKKPE